MLIAIIIGLAGLTINAIAFANRDDLDDRPALRRNAPYLLSAVITLAVAAGIGLVLAHDHTRVGSLVR